MTQPPVDDAATARRKALSAAARRADQPSGFVQRVRPDERRRYVFQVWTTSAFAAVWLLVFVLSGSWLFLAIAGGFGVLAVLAGSALLVLRRAAPDRPARAAGHETSEDPRRP